MGVALPLIQFQFLTRQMVWPGKRITECFRAYRQYSLRCAARTDNFSTDTHPLGLLAPWYIRPTPTALKVRHRAVLATGRLLLG